MDLISRESVTNELERHKYSRDYCVLHNIDWAIDFGMAMASVDFIPSAFEGMTNGEVFQAIFPCDEVHINGFQDGCVHFSMKSNLDTLDCFDLEWWNAPYKGESEEV